MDQVFHSADPKAIQLSSTIPGFALGLDGMRIGEKRRLFVHRELAYGETGSWIEPNQLMIFDIELVEIQSRSVSGE